MMEIIPIVGVAIALAAGGFQIWRHFNPTCPPRILNPKDGAECGGRNVTVSGVVPRRRRKLAYWVVIQPCNCRGAGIWWPQRQALKLDSKGAWVLENATLGRVGSEDIGATFTIALFGVLPAAQAKFLAVSKKGEQLSLASVSEYCSHFHSVEVRRVG